ncbi:hypothetical protein GSI_01860 [Ganoderma sinense ZZ0214-1]|uniref:Cryptic loci regulator 2 N-terminal domain-containing protein n=1 Tax=Ganoderma sinense ZZ0214-1 TaxID=1077348 RepID=A0A2G8SR05_9APHY|nr:hypothetical protein GSI_01860 [Ganoderma sinense ZZ0214-1]
MDKVITVITTPLYEAGLHQKTMYIALRDNATDAASELRPLQPVPSDNAKGDVDFYQEAEDKLDRLWRTKLGRYLYDYVVKEDLKKEGIRLPYSPDEIMLVSLPKHYTLWVHKKGNAADPRQDAYLHGSRFVNKFRSPAEFCHHLKWLLHGQPTKANGKPACDCRYCDGSRSQAEISQGFGAYHKRDHHGGGRSRGGGRTRAQESPIVVYKDYRKW